MSNEPVKSVYNRYPWLRNLKPIADGIIATLMVKEPQYKASWQKRGGVGAFMMLCRKWDRIEGIAKEDYGYDVIQAVRENKADIIDDIDDLIGYLLLVRSYVKTEQEVAKPYQPATPVQELAPEPPEVVVQKRFTKLTLDMMQTSKAIELGERVKTIFGVYDVSNDGFYLILRCDDAGEVWETLVKNEMVDPTKVGHLLE